MIIRLSTLLVVFCVLNLSAQDETVFPENFSAFENLLGEKVYINNDAVGEIDRVIINRETGNVSSIVVASPVGLMDLTFRYYVIPYDIISQQSGRIALDVELPRFKKAPYIPEQNYNQNKLLNRHWVEESYDYYDVIKYEFGIYDEIGNSLLAQQEWYEDDTRIWDGPKLYEFNEPWDDDEVDFEDTPGNDAIWEEDEEFPDDEYFDEYEDEEPWYEDDDELWEDEAL